MPTPRTGRTSSRTQRAGKPQQNAVRRKKRATARRKPQDERPRTAHRKPTRKSALLNWRDLATDNERVARRPRTSAYIERVSTVRFGLLLLAIAAVFTLYIGHVHATQDVLAELQQARRENLQLHLTLNRLKGDFDRATGPTVIYQRARALGLEEGIAYGPTIEME